MPRSHKKIADLLETPEKTANKVSKWLFLTAGQSLMVSFSLSLIVFLSTGSFTLDIGFRTIITISVGGISIVLFCVTSYILKRLKEYEQYLITIAIKHRDVVDEFSKYQLQSDQVLTENNKLKEIINTQMRELNRAILELACEKQKGFEEVKILQAVQEAMNNAH